MSQSISFTEFSAAYHSFVRHLYESAFPMYERRTWEQLLSLLPQKNMQLIVAVQNETPIGFAICWKLNDWYFLEHLVIDPLQEGKGYGSTIMQYLLQQSGNRLLLETELPTDEKGHRRIRFYQRIGLRITPFYYQQPPYRKAEVTPAMHIMSTPVIADKAEFLNITTVIRQQVFEAFY